MKLHLTRPIVFFDLETTGVQVGSDKIVEIGLLKIMPDNSSIEKTYLVNPGIPIPETVSLIHGIYDKDVADKPTFRELAPTILEFIKDCDLSGYNLLKFDIPMLVEEFLRIGMELDLRAVRVVDVQNIFHRMEQRTLAAAYRFYCGEELADAHSAQADTMATFKVLEAQLSHYENVTRKDENGNDYCPIQNDVNQLAAFSTTNRNVDFAGHIIFDKNDVEVFNFGKYKGQSVESVFAREISYFNWMMNADFPLYTKKVISNIRKRMQDNHF